MPRADASCRTARVLFSTALRCHNGPMQSSRLPSLRAVEIFVAAGRALNFAAAAEAVHLTPSAVSRRIQSLEHELGTPLFKRFNRRVELTAAGARFLEAAGHAIELILEESTALRPHRENGVLRLSVLQSLASTWLLPRLAAFRRQRPDIELSIETSAGLVDLAAREFDAAIRFGEGRWPGLVANPLFKTRAFPVAAPEYWPCGFPVSAEALDRATFLGIAQMPDLWPQYFAGVGLPGYRPRRLQIFDNLQVAQEAAAYGFGLALTARELAQPQLRVGRLAPAFCDEPVTLRQTYYFACRKDRRDEAGLRALRTALLRMS